MPGGRPSKYKPEYAEQAYKFCLLGATDAELADFFSVEETTINNWKLAHPEFLESLARGKETADASVAERLFKRALGYSHDAVKIFMPAGAKEPVYADYTEHYPPDTPAAALWLSNRQPAKWRQKSTTELTGVDGKDLHLTDNDLSAKLAAILEAAAKRQDGG